MWILFNWIRFVANTWEVATLLCLEAFLRGSPLISKSHKSCLRGQLCLQPQCFQTPIAAGLPKRRPGGWFLCQRPQGVSMGSLELQAQERPAPTLCVITTLRHKGAAVSSTLARKWISSSRALAAVLSLPKLGASPSRFLSGKLFSLYERWPWAAVLKLGI